MSGEKDGGGATGSSGAPTGAPSKGHEHTQGENMTNGIPDAVGEDRATALPHTEREESETAAGQRGGGDADD